MLYIKRPIGLPILKPIIIAMTENTIMIIIRINIGWLWMNLNNDSLGICNILRLIYY